MSGRRQTARQTVRDVTSVAVSTPVSGKHPRKPRTEQRSRTSAVTTNRVDKHVLARAREVCRPGERLRIVSETCVVTVYES